MEKKHTDVQLEKELAEIRNRLLLMAGRVEEMIRNAVRAVVERDPELARQTIKTDRLVNRDEIEIDEKCLVVLARWQPMATDLRFLTLALKMVTDLERIGDLAVNVCERAISLGREPPLKPFIDIPRMAEIVQSMLHDAVQAFVDGDDGRAEQVIARDDEVDELYHSVFRELLGIMRQDESKVERGVQVQAVAKLLERMADHCTNLAEQVIFLTRGEDVRHAGKLGRQ
ncbi:MAG: phosphate transport system regulatory protein PhoU [Deltaproteobacteria bacterium]|nr:MAG: phosphate transport system regulatory protein PhoU [Deltaproteobacteria bacterium]